MLTHACVYVYVNDESEPACLMKVNMRVCACVCLHVCVETRARDAYIYMYKTGDGWVIAVDVNFLFRQLAWTRVARETKSLSILTAAYSD